MHQNGWNCKYLQSLENIKGNYIEITFYFWSPGATGSQPPVLSNHGGMVILDFKVATWQIYIGSLPKSTTHD
jgi:hypothetical protein